MDAQRPTRLLRIPEVAEILGVSRTTVYRLINDNAITTTTVGKVQRVSEEAVTAFIARNTKERLIDIEPKEE